jgi:hypothetical protein
MLLSHCLDTRQPSPVLSASLRLSADIAMEIAQSLQRSTYTFPAPLPPSPPSSSSSRPNSKLKVPAAPTTRSVFCSVDVVVVTALSYKDPPTTREGGLVSITCYPGGVFQRASSMMS